MKLSKKIGIIICAIFTLLLLGIIVFMGSSHKTSVETIKLTYSGKSNYQGVDNNKGVFNVNSMDSVTTMSDSFDSGFFEINESSSFSDDYSEEYIEEEYDTGESTLTQDKMLKKTYNYDVETTEFDDFYSSLKEKIDSLGGYIEDEDTVSREVNNSVFTETYRVRRLNCTVRIPVDSVSDLLKLVDNSADVISKREYIEDVTSDYLDTEMYINSLKEEYKVLEGLLQMTTSVTEIIEVQDRLSYINREIESYEMHLESLKTDIAYSKLDLTVEEVIYYEDEVERWTSDLAESWANIFEEWVEDILLPIILITISLIPAISLVLVSIYLLMRAITKFKKKNQQVIILKQEKE